MNLEILVKQDHTSCQKNNENKTVTTHENVT